MRTDNLNGILAMVLGIACFSIMDAMGKWVVRDYSIFQVLAVRSLFAGLILFALAPMFGGREVIGTRQPIAQVARGLCATLAFLFFFASVRVLPLADAIAVEFGGPFIVIALSVPILGEQVDRGRWLAVAVGFLGMLLIVRPTGEGFRPEALLVLAASFSYSMMMVLTRWMSTRSGPAEKTFTFLVYTVGVQALVGFSGSLFTWERIGANDVAFVAAMGVFHLAGLLGVTLAFQKAPASVVVPFEYTALVWATIFGFFIFGDFPGPGVWLGVAIIVGAGLYTVRRESSTRAEPSAVAQPESAE